MFLWIWKHVSITNKESDEALMQSETILHSPIHLENQMTVVKIHLSSQTDIQIQL